MTPWVAVLVAFFVWWFATGFILMVVKHADLHGPWMCRAVTLGSLPLLIAGFWGYAFALTDTSIYGIYLAFFSALVVWGWVELAFLTGIIAGPIQKPLPEGVGELERFLRAWGTVAFHEMLLVGILIVLVFLGWGTDNMFGMWIFIVLYAARLSAKLNLYFGVPKVNIEFLPTMLCHLPSHFRRRAMNWFFPISVSVLTFVIACWLQRLQAAASPADAIGFALLTAITALALFEHWMMVLPLPDERLWRWMLPTGPSTSKTYTSLPTRQEDAHGL